MKNVVVFCGGRGASGLVRSLSRSYNLKLIVNAYDDGHSTGRLREIFNILGPSDCRKNAQYLVEKSCSPKISNLFNLRLENAKVISEVNDELNRLINSTKLTNYNESDSATIKWLTTSTNQIIQRLKELPQGESLLNCSLMNLLLVNEVLNENSFQEGIDSFLKGFGVQEEIIINSEDNLALLATNMSGHTLLSEGEIVEGRSSEIIDQLYLIPYEKQAEIVVSIKSTKDYYKRIKILQDAHKSPSLSKRALNALDSADIIIYAAGTANSSLYPTYFTKDLPSVIANSNAHKIMLVNIGADYETPDYKASNFVSKTLHFLQQGLDNTEFPNKFINTAFINIPTDIDRFHIVFDYKDPIFNEIEVESGDFEHNLNKGRHSEEFYKKLNQFINSITGQ